MKNCGNPWHSTVQNSTAQYSTVQYGTVQHGTVQYNTAQCSTVQYSTVQYSTVQYSTVQYSKAPKNAEPRILKCRIKRCDMTVYLTSCSAGQCIALMHKSRLHNRSPRAAQSCGREWRSTVYVKTVQHNEAQCIEPGMEDKTIQ